LFKQDESLVIIARCEFSIHCLGVGIADHTI
jgi:hypothetical protein